MTKVRIGITGWGSISALGTDPEGIWEAYRHPKTLIRHSENGYFCPLNEAEEVQVDGMRRRDRNFRGVDRSVLLALVASEKAYRRAGWKEEESFGVNIGASRGATALFERYYDAFLKGGEKALTPHVSPVTTLGNISSWVGNLLGAKGPLISHSITCSTALHAVLNGVSWLESGRSRQFLVGGSEAPLTPFTIAQMKALRIYAGSSSQEEMYPCRAGDPEKSANTMVLGEGAASFCLESEPRHPLAVIEGIGYGTEQVKTATGLSDEGLCLLRSMRMAWEEAGRPPVEALVTHTPGTRRGDRSEWRAVRKVFEKNTPPVTNNKWKIGHTLGASGALSLEMALLMLRHGQLIEVPYLQPVEKRKPVRRVMINAVGFGGNAVSLLLGHPDG